MRQWQLYEAEAHMEELVWRAQVAPQEITLEGRTVAVVLSRATFEVLSSGKESLLDFMQASPLADSKEASFERDRSRARRVPRL